MTDGLFPVQYMAPKPVLASPGSIPRITILYPVIVTDATEHNHRIIITGLIRLCKLDYVDFRRRCRYTVTVSDEEMMLLCLVEAQTAYDEEEVPVGALVVSPDNRVLSMAHNRTRTDNRPTAHAEVLAVEEAARQLSNYRLVGCTLCVSKEPCVMCAGAIIESRIKRLVFGCFDTKAGAFGSFFDINKLALNHKVEVRGGVLREKSEELLKSFFQARRGTEVAITGPTRNRLYV